MSPFHASPTRVRGLQGLSLALVALMIVGCSIFQDESLTATGPKTPTSETCGHCHMRQYEEWKDSTHAVAFTNDAFRTATDDYRLEDCLGCHAPESVFEGRQVDARQVHRAEGVNCVACHFLDGAMQGPIEHTSFVEPHPMGAPNPLYRSSELCGLCHARALEQWRTSEVPEKRTCQECHMPAVTRTVTQADDFIGSLFVAMEEEKEQRKHTFHLDAVADLEDAFDLSIEPSPQGLRVVLENRLPHSVPTGSFGTRRVRLLARILDGNGIAREFEHVFQTQDDRALHSGSRHALECEVGTPVNAEVTLSRVATRGRGAVVLARKTWELPR